MHISKLCLVNYRNFPNATLLFKKGINTVIGENGSGKTNLFRAIRLLLDDNMLRFTKRLDETDFHRGLGKWQGHWIIVSLEFEDVSQDEAIQSLFLHANGNIASSFIQKATYNLVFRPKTEVRRKFSQLMAGDQVALAALQQSVTIDDYETIFTGRSEADFNKPGFYTAAVGDFANVVFPAELEIPELGSKVPTVLSMAKEISFTHVQALRDVVADFQNNRTNPLLTLLKRKSGEIDPMTFAPIVAQVQTLNSAISSLPDVRKVRDDIELTIKQTAGQTYAPTSLSIKSELSDEADRLFQSLKLFVGESEKGYEGAIHELSLGGANLIYLTLKLLEFQYQKALTTFANFLLIEEPEAHIHTHIQKTLFDRINYPDTQVIYTTHSTQISEVCNVRNMNIVARTDGKCEAYQPCAGLTDAEIRNIQRYLDAVRSNLLFAKSVILVEGDAEEILVPLLVRQTLGVSLDELGISLINIRSTGFKNVAVLFHDSRIRKKCSIVTDLDASVIDTTPNSTDLEDLAQFKQRCKGSAKAGTERKAILEAFVLGNSCLALYLAQHTFEIDLFLAGNRGLFLDAVEFVYKQKELVAQSRADLNAADPAVFGRRVLAMAEYEGKGWFAVLLGNLINCRTIIPDYLARAIFYGATMTNELWFNILDYRLRCMAKMGQSTAEIGEYRIYIDGFRLGLLDAAFMKKEFASAFPTDPLNRVLNIALPHVLP
jgi:putative ATP-dependent endonuclease of the OLD family